MNPAAAISSYSSKATTATCLFVFLISFYIVRLITSHEYHHHKPPISSSSDFHYLTWSWSWSWSWWVLGIGAAIVVIIAAVVTVVRTTMVTWITVLVLLAFAGNRRRILVKNGKKITSEVAMHLFKIVFVKERSFAVLATLASLLMAILVCLRNIL